MISPRFKKILGDLRVYRGRFTLIALALFASLFGVTALFTNYRILQREVPDNYARTLPAHATFEVENPDAELLGSARGMPGVESADLRAILSGRALNPEGEWQNLRLFAVQDFDPMPLARFFPESGAWPPAAGEVLLERSVSELFRIEIGAALEVDLPGTGTASLTIAGTTHDPSLAPAWQEETIYGYISRETLEALSPGAVFDDLKVRFALPNPSLEDVRTAGRIAADTLLDLGYTVREVQIPPPGRHPHQSQMDTILGIFLVFGFLILLLSAILSANLIAILMRKEVRQIGILKTIGAASPTVATLYLGTIGVLCFLVILLALPLGIAGGQAFSASVANTLNVNLASSDPGHAVVLVVLLSGLIIPGLLTLVPVVSASRKTIREALSEQGISAGYGRREAAGSSGSVTWNYIRRNGLRRRGRVLLSVVLLGFSGTLFVTSLNVNRGWDRVLDNAKAVRTWTMEVRTAGFVSPESVRDALTGLPNFDRIEVWSTRMTSPYSLTGYRISELYPDGGHGAFLLREIPRRSTSLRLPVKEGSWVDAASPGSLVLNQRASAIFPDLTLGGELTLLVDGAPSSYRLGGIVEEMGPATAYLPLESEPSLANSYLFFGSIQVEELLERLEAAGIPTAQVLSSQDFSDAMDGHIFIIIFALLALSILMAAVGIVGLAASVSTGIAERRREFGVLRTIGAGDGRILGIVFGETFLVSALALVAGLVAAIPLSSFLGEVLGNMAFQIPLPFEFSGSGVLVWVILLGFGTLFSALLPASGILSESIQSTIKEE